MSKYVVCPACDGEGKDFSTSYALTSQDIYDYAGDDYYERAAFVQSVADLTQPCACCHGQRVVTAQDRLNWIEDEELRYEIEAERRMESRMLGEW